MSEIIASIYDCMEATGLERGILFLDEINCVSETLAPSMLQFLQYKTFGRHRVPQGWIMVTAGNPPEYNNSVREFDIVTWDRMKRIDVEPDYGVWKTYAAEKGVHPAVTSYLEIHQGRLLPDRVHRGRQAVRHGPRLGGPFGHDEAVREERLPGGRDADPAVPPDDRVAKSFAVYYDLFKKYRSDYQVDDILAGKATKKIEDRAAKAKFDERLSLLGLLLDAVGGDFKTVAVTEGMMTQLMNDIRAMRVQLARVDAAGAADLLQKQAAKLESAAQAGRRANSMSEDAARASRRAAQVMTEMAAALDDAATACSPSDHLKALSTTKREALKTTAARVRARLDNMFAFCEKAFPEGQELLILVTELTASPAAARFIARYGCDAYFRHSHDLMFHERRNELRREIERVRLE